MNKTICILMTMITATLVALYLFANYKCYRFGSKILESLYFCIPSG